MSKRLTTEQREALRLIAVAETAEDGALATTSHTSQIGSTALIHWRTTAALLRRDLIEAESYDARWDSLSLTDAGWDIAEPAWRERLTPLPAPVVPASQGGAE